jgi:NADPH:quinone reductase-like Zn-dependent oxidoreductase
MLALRYHSIGDLAGLGLEDIPVPVPAADEVLVRIRAASLNPVDWKIATGSFRPIVRGGVPRTMGSDFAGEVMAIGSGVTTLAPGDRVFGFIDPFRRTGGTFAEFAAVPVEFAHHLPAELGYTDSAALACVGATAVTLCNLGRVGTGGKVLVNGASGGVGHVAVQVAHARGAIVTATASAARHEFVRSLGAHVCIDYRTEPMDRWPGDFDTVVDCVPNIPRAMQRRLLRRRGHYVTTVPNAATFMIDPLTNRCGGVQRHGVMLKPDAGVMNEVLGYVAQGRLRCAIEREFSLQLARDAIERSRSGRVQGKIVLRIS